MMVLSLPPVASQHSGHLPDPRALQVAQWVQARVATGTVWLFGSRARGDWTDDSDIDLALLSPEQLAPGTPWTLSEDLASEVERLYGTYVPLQLSCLTFEEFEKSRMSPNHLAGGIQRDGLDAAGCPMAPIKQNNPWPDVQQRLRAVRKELHVALRNEGMDEPATALFYIESAVENGLKAYASACGLRYDKNHNLVALADAVQEVDATVALPSRDWLKAMARFRVNIPYNVDYPLPFPALPTLTDMQSLCSQMAARCLALCGKTVVDLGYGELEHVLLDLSQPLGGVESADPAAFRTETQVRMAREQTLKQSYKSYLRHVHGEQAATVVSEFLDTVENLPPLADYSLLDDLVAVFQQRGDLQQYWDSYKLAEGLG